MIARTGLVLTALVLLAACASETGSVEGPASPVAAPTGSQAGAPTGAQTGPEGALPQPQGQASRSDQIALSAKVPHIYMAIQPGGSAPHSVVFAIDQGRDNSPSDDSAVRLTPENGKCNPQQMQRFRFPAEYARRPIFGPEESRRGIGARDVPNFMAMAVTSEMMRLGLVVQPDESRPQNVCTRKLWEQLIVSQSLPGS